MRKPISRDVAMASLKFDLDLYHDALAELYRDAAASHSEFWMETVARNPERLEVTFDQVKPATKRDIKSGMVAIVLNSLLQDLAKRLGLARGKNLRAGCIVSGEPLTRIIWAASNNARHVYDWYQIETFDPKDPHYAESMLVLQPVLLCKLPIHGYMAWPALNLFDPYERLEKLILQAAEEMVHQKFS